MAVDYRVAMLSPDLGAFGTSLEPCRPTDLDIPPAEYRELRGQMATFDAVAPRLAVLFALLGRGLHD